MKIIPKVKSAKDFVGMQIQHCKGLFQIEKEDHINPIIHDKGISYTINCPFCHKGIYIEGYAV